MMKGQTLIEVLIALATAVIVVSGITVLAISSLSNVQFTKEQDQATKYAQEGMEVTRGIRNNDYIGFRAYSGYYCLAKGQVTFGSAVATCAAKNIDNTYIRSVQIQQNACGVNLANVTVSVAWTDTKCPSGAFCHNSKLTSCFSTVSPIVAP
jgi:Tfp pilus assembly protein PilV